MVALFFGGLTVAFAFVAEYLGGVLQASLTIFGVVGGPLLALFTIGMFSTAVEQKVNVTLHCKRGTNQLKFGDREQ